MLNTYQEASRDASGQSLCLQLPDQGLRGAEQEHDRFVVSVHRGDGVQMQGDLEDSRQQGSLVLVPQAEQPDPSHTPAQEPRDSSQHTR